MITELQGTMGSAAAWSVAYGDGCAAPAIEGTLTRTGAERVLAVTSPTVRRSRPFAELSAKLGHRLVSVFDGVVPHLPREVVFEARSAFVASGADAVLTVGGGSTSDAGKALRLALALELSGPSSFDDLPDGPISAGIPHIAVPTTLSGAEYSTSVGVTDLATRRKRPVTRPGLAPTLTVLDPSVAAATPTELWAVGGLKVLSDAVEIVTSADVRPHLAPLAVQAVAWFLDSLAPARIDTVDGRLRMQLGSWATTFTIVQSGSRLGTSTALRHLLGPALNVPHAAVSAIFLPHVYRFESAAVPRGRHATLAHALGLGDPADPSATVAARLTEAVAGEFGPSGLAGFGATEGDLRALAPVATEEIRASSSWRKDVDADAVTELLLAAL